MAHASTAQLAEWLDVEEEDLVEGAARLLDRATDVIDDAVVSPYVTDAEDVLAALADATCAQVEFWLEVGEEHDVTGQRGQIAIGGQGGLAISRLPSTLAPRARRALALENLLSRSVQSA